jgi:hypothetical protein
MGCHAGQAFGSDAAGKIRAGPGSNANPVPESGKRGVFRLRQAAERVYTVIVSNSARVSLLENPHVVDNLWDERVCTVCKPWIVGEEQVFPDRNARFEMIKPLFAPECNALVLWKKNTCFPNGWSFNYVDSRSSDIRGFPQGSDRPLFMQVTRYFGGLFFQISRLPAPQRMRAISPALTT